MKLKNLLDFDTFVNESYLADKFLYKINEESFNDYPQGAIDAAKKALKWKEEYGDEVDAGTQVGWTRANQLANKEKISFDTIKRMKAFFDRHEGNKSIDPKLKDTPWKDNGYVSWLIWGGDPAYKWAKDKIKEIESTSESISNIYDYNDAYVEESKYQSIKEKIYHFLNRITGSQIDKSFPSDDAAKEYLEILGARFILREEIEIDESKKPKIKVGEPIKFKDNFTGTESSGTITEIPKNIKNVCKVKLENSLTSDFKKGDEIYVPFEDIIE